MIRSPERPPRPDDDRVAVTFTRDNLGKVCTLVRAAGTQAGIAPRDIEDLLMAVSEVVTNAVSYAGGIGSIMVRPVAGGLLAEIRDNGPGLPDGMMTEGPSSDFPADGGLWRARRLCKEFSILSSPLGVTVRMFTPRRRFGTADVDTAVEGAVKQFVSVPIRDLVPVVVERREFAMEDPGGL